MAGVRFGDIEERFFSSAPHPTGPIPPTSTWRPGQVLYQSEMADLDEIGDEEMDWDHMIEIPHKNDLDLGQRLVFDFVEANLPEDHHRVRDIFRMKRRLRPVQGVP